MHYLMFSIKIKMPLHQLKCTMYHLSDLIKSTILRFIDQKYID